MLTVYGVVVLTFMMVMYALEGRDRRFVLAFAVGCALASSYGFASGAVAVRGGRSDLVRGRAAPLLVGAGVTTETDYLTRAGRIALSRLGSCRESMLSRVERAAEGAHWLAFWVVGFLLLVASAVLLTARAGPDRTHLGPGQPNS